MRFPPIFVPKPIHTEEERICYLLYNLYKSNSLSERQLRDPKTRAQIELGKFLHEQDAEIDRKVIPISIKEKREEKQLIQQARKKEESMHGYWVQIRKQNEEKKRQEAVERIKSNLKVLSNYSIKKEDKNG